MSAHILKIYDASGREIPPDEYAEAIRQAPPYVVTARNWDADIAGSRTIDEDAESGAQQA